MTDVTGVVLAGGQSRRFGSPKARAQFAGQLLLDRVLAALGQVCPSCLVVGGDPSDAASLGIPYERDAWPGVGPLGGLYTALLLARTEWILVCACDMPLVDAALLRELLHVREGCDIVLPEHDGRPQPLCAAYARRIWATVARALVRGDRTMTSFHDGLRVRRLRPETVDALANVNTPDDLLRLEAAHGGA